MSQNPPYSCGHILSEVHAQTVSHEESYYSTYYMCVGSGLLCQSEGVACYFNSAIMSHSIYIQHDEMGIS